MIQRGKTTRGEREKRIKTIAQKVIKNISEGKRGGIVEVMKEVGYSRETAESKSGTITKDPIYIREMEKFEDKLSRVMDISFDIIENKKDDATFSHGVDALDKMTKLKRLIDGKSTENHAHMIANVLDGLEEETKSQHDNTSDTTSQEEK